MSRLFRYCMVFPFFMIMFCPVFSQEQISIPRIEGGLKFDGIIDDDGWQNIQPLNMVMHTPTFGNQPTEKSEVMICYDNTYLYVGARLYDSNPSGMLISSKKRDESEVSSEELMLIFDSFNDKENALGFSTTPTGLRSDFTISKDAMGMDGPPGQPPFNLSWNTFWDVKTTKNEKGWYVEMRIPFSSMRFKEINNKIVMGFICIRKIAHKNEVDIFPSIPPNWGFASPYRPSKAQEITFDGLKSKKPFYIAPYLIGGYQLDNIMNEAGTAYKLDKNPSFNGGLDVKYGLTNNLTMDLTINTDFAQVEADDEQINLTRFSLFFPEKRTFFQERSSVFSFDFEPGGSLFYSRRIGLNSGKQVPIYGGARVTGMIGKWDIGFLDMQTHAVNGEGGLNSLSSENFGILRLRRQVINENSYVGGILTSRIGTDGSYNTAYGMDGIFKVFDNDYLNIKLAQVLENASPNKILSLNPTELFLSWNRFNQKGLNYNFTYARSGKDFNPGIGFFARNNYTHYYGGLGYGWIPGESSAIQNHQIGANVISYFDNADNSAQSLQTGIMYDLSFKSGFSGMISVNHVYENVADTFSFSKDAYVPAGKYGFNEFETHLNSPRTNKFVLGIDGFAGTFYDGTRFTFGAEPSWNIGSSLQLGLKYQHNFLNFNSRNQKFSGAVAGFKALVMISTKLSVSTFIQYNSAENTAMTNFRLRYNPREGNDFYIVINEGRSTYRNIENPRLPLYNNRSVLLKYTYTFTL